MGNAGRGYALQYYILGGVGESCRFSNWVNTSKLWNKATILPGEALKTDSIFFRLFQTQPGLLFELLGQSPELGQGYEFRSVEIKQLAFRIDGVLLPSPGADDQTVFFLEVQFQEDRYFYHRFFAEIFLFLDQYPQTADWQAVVIFPKRTVEPRQQWIFRVLLGSEQVQRVYLEDLHGVTTESVGLGLMQLIVADQGVAVAQAKALLSRVQQQPQTDWERANLIELIETVVVYKFPQLSREAIEQMLGISELRQTRVFQEALEEGRQEGKCALVLRLLHRRLGTLPEAVTAQVQALSVPQLEALGEALLDFATLADLEAWLASSGRGPSV